MMWMKIDYGYVNYIQVCMKCTVNVRARLHHGHSMVQCEVPHSQRDFSLWDSIGGRKEDNFTSERLKSVGIFSGGVEALIFPRYLRKCQTFQRSIKVIRDP